jgi:outer membrane protein OmpA-like peptidoglycan-associated protein
MILQNEIEVIGFTDTLGDLPSNQALSLARAATIRSTLVGDALDRQAISIAGRGKRDLLPTADQTPEPAIGASRSRSGKSCATLNAL